MLSLTIPTTPPLIFQGLCLYLQAKELKRQGENEQATELFEGAVIYLQPELFRTMPGSEERRDLLEITHECYRNLKH